MIGEAEISIYFDKFRRISDVVVLLHHAVHVIGSTWPIIRKLAPGLRVCNHGGGVGEARAYRALSSEAPPGN